MTLWRLMMAKFEIGEIALAYNDDTGDVSECEIIAVPGHSLPIFPCGDYVINVPTNKSSTRPNGYWEAEEKFLRKKKPPEELSTWEEVQKLTNWNPKKVAHDG